MTEPAEEPPAAGITRQDVFSVLGALGAIITLATAIMFYFGWRRSEAQASEMSIDVSLFGFSSQDYVLRSVSSLFVPMLVTVAIGLVWVWCHRRLTALLHSGRLGAEPARSRVISAARTTFVVAVAVAAACVLVSALAGERWAPWPIRPTARALQTREWVIPLVLVVATVIAAYAKWVGDQLSGRQREPSRSPWLSVLPAALVASTLLLSGFWILEEYAAAVGRDLASDLAARADRLPDVVVTGPAPLGIEAPGVSEERVSVDPPRYRTTGLRLLARSGGKVILVHDGWRPGAGRVIVVADGDELTWQFSR